MLKCLLVGLGGFVGAVFRYLISLAFLSAPMSFPMGTLTINLVGSVLIGVISEYSFRIMPINTNLLLFLCVGVCGGFTTFSTFSFETVSLIENGRIATAICYGIASVVLCIAGVAMGRLVIWKLAVNVLGNM